MLKIPLEGLELASIASFSVGNLQHFARRIQKRHSLRPCGPALGHALTPSPRWCLRKCQVPLCAPNVTFEDQPIHSLFLTVCIALICIDLHWFALWVEAEVFFMHVLFASALMHAISKATSGRVFPIISALWFWKEASNEPQLNLAVAAWAMAFLTTLLHGVLPNASVWELFKLWNKN